MLIEIKSWINGKVLHTIEADSIKLAVEALVRRGADLGGRLPGGRRPEWRRPGGRLPEGR